MGLKCNEPGATTDESAHQASPGGRLPSIPNSPLDLSKNSTTHPFFHPPTPDKCSSPSPMDISGRNPFQFRRQMSQQSPFQAPRILIQPKSEWHYRNMKDLAIQHIPLLSGNGPQRTPIRVSVPPRADQTMYLCIQILTIAGQAHPSKVIVPAKTKADNARVARDNNLDCLQFDQCDPSDIFDASNRCIYSKIHSNEHISQYKDVRVHMFNLYQSQTITKEVIERQELHLARLSFHFCYRSNDEYTDLSDRSFSDMITEKRNNTRASKPESNQESMSINEPYAQMHIDSSSEDATTRSDPRTIICVTVYQSG